MESSDRDSARERPRVRRVAADDRVQPDPVEHDGRRTDEPHRRLVDLGVLPPPPVIEEGVFENAG